MILGGVTSTTVMVKEQVAVLPAPSVTRNTLVVAPKANVLLGAKPDVCVVIGLAQLSIPIGAI